MIISAYVCLLLDPNRLHRGVELIDFFFWVRKASPWEELCFRWSPLYKHVPKSFLFLIKRTVNLEKLAIFGDLLNTRPEFVKGLYWKAVCCVHVPQNGRNMQYGAKKIQFPVEWSIITGTGYNCINLTGSLSPNDSIEKIGSLQPAAGTG